MSSGSLLRGLVGGGAALALLGLAWWGAEPSVVRVPGVVTPSLEYRVEHLGDGRIRWRLLDGAVPGGPSTQVEGVFVEVRGEPLTVELAPGAAAGRHVEAGAALVEVRAPGAISGAAAARAERDAAAADLAVLESGGRPGIVAAAEADVEVAEAALNEARAQEVLVAGLVEQGAAGAWELQTASLAVAVAEAQVAAARASVGAAINQPHSTEVVAARDRVLAAEARMELADARAAATTLRSPIAGKAFRPGGSVLVTVKDPSVALVQVAVPEALRSRVGPGASADFRPTQGGDAVPAQVLSVGETAVAGPSGPVVWTLARLENPLPFGSTGILRIVAGGGR